MSKHVIKILDFPAHAAQKPDLVRNSKASGSWALTVVNVNNSCADRIAPKRPVGQDSWNQRNFPGRSEYLIGIPVTLALHLLWLFSMPEIEIRESIKPPRPIMVEWLGNPHTHAEPAKPLPQPKLQKNQEKPVVKPKQKPRKVAAKPSKPIITAPRKADEPPATQALATPPAPEAAVQPMSMATAAVKPDATDQTPITLPHLNADYLDNPAPEYPPVSRQLGEQGRVLVRAIVNADGNVGQVLLRKSSGFSRLDQAALASVKHWRFVPDQRGGQKIPAWVVVPVIFTIEG